MNQWTTCHQYDDTYFVLGPRPSPEKPPKIIATVHGAANARLVEKAPKLLEVLKSTLAALDDASSVVDAGPDEEYAYQGEIESARALIREIGSTRQAHPPTP